MYRITGPVTAGAAIPFELLEKAGLACGSETMSKFLVDHVERYANSHPDEHPGGFENTLRILRMTRAQAESQLADDFEAIKSTPNANKFVLSLESRNPATGRDVSWSFTIVRWVKSGFEMAYVFMMNPLQRDDPSVAAWNRAQDHCPAGGNARACRSAHPAMYRFARTTKGVDDDAHRRSHEQPGDS